MIYKGYLLLTDISGYTMFLTQSELDHADDILQQLFKTLFKHIQPPLILSNLQGDAILSYLPESADLHPQTVIETVERLYYDFRRQLELMKINTTCTCNACANMSILDLKVFVHYGSYLLQELGDKKELVGSDVILAHRMMKNSVKEKTGLNGYALLTDKALEPLAGTTLLTPLLPHTEDYEHIGTVGMQIYPLANKWDEEREKRRVRLDRDTAWSFAFTDLDVPAEAAWNMLVDFELMKQWLVLDDFLRTDDQGGRVQTGSQMHCVHVGGAVDLLVLDWNPNEFYLTCRAINQLAGLQYRVQIGLEQREGGSRCYTVYEQPTGGENLAEADSIRPEFQEANEQAMANFSRVLQEQIEAGKIIVGENPVIEGDMEWIPPEPIV